MRFLVGLELSFDELIFLEALELPEVLEDLEERLQEWHQEPEELAACRNPRHTSWSGILLCVPLERTTTFVSHSRSIHLIECSTSF